MEPRRSSAELRQEIARLDREILERLEARARTSKEIRLRAENEPVADTTDREALTALTTAASGDLPAEALTAIFSAIRASARAIEQAPHKRSLDDLGASLAAAGMAEPGEVLRGVYLGLSLGLLNAPGWAWTQGS